MSSTIRLGPSAAAAVLCALLSAGAGAQQVFETVHLDGEEAVYRGTSRDWRSMALGPNGHTVFITQNANTQALTYWRWSPGSTPTPIGPVSPVYDGVEGVFGQPTVVAVDGVGDALVVDRGWTLDGEVGFVFAELVGGTVRALAATEPMAVGPGVLGVQINPGASFSIPNSTYIDRHGVYLGRLRRHVNRDFPVNQLISITRDRGVRLHRTPGTPVPGGIGVFGDLSAADFRSRGEYRGNLATTFDITPTGDIVFFSRIVEPTGEVRGGGIFREGPDGLRLIARNDIPNPSNNQMYSPFALAANDAGRIIYKGTATPAGASDPVFGIWRMDAEGQVDPLILRNDSVPWLEAGIDLAFHGDSGWSKQQLKLAESGDAIVRMYSRESINTISRVEGTIFMHIRPDGSASVLLPQYRSMEPHEAPYRRFDPEHMRNLIADDARSVALGAYLTTHDGALVVGLIVAHVDFGLHEIVRHGDMFEVAPGDLRQVNLFEVLEHQAGARTIFRLGFTDGTSGFFYSQLTAPVCRADLNNDGVVDADDFFLFLRLFAAGHPRADINGDGVIDADDFYDYLDLFAHGC